MATKKHDPNKCQQCQEKKAQPDHNCPYQNEIMDDNEFMCDCCDECRDNCADEI